MKVFPFSVDSIMVHIEITNNSKSDYLLYKPLLPMADFSERLFGIMEAESYVEVKFVGKSEEKHLENKGALLPLNVIPDLNITKFAHINSKETQYYKVNIADKYDFKSHLNKNVNQFRIIYSALFPYVVYNKQVVEMDTVDKIEKPVYFHVTLDKKEDLDSMRIFFEIPNK